MVMPKLVRAFTDPTPPNPKAMLGGKGAHLNLMAREMGLPVPPGFTIPTNECIVYHNTGKLRPSLMQSIWREIEEMEAATGQKFGGGRNPLLVSVRSGAEFSMPGMMETVLNLGMNERTVAALSASSNADFAWDSYRRFVQMYCTIVGGIPANEFHDRTELIRSLCNGTIPAEGSQLLVKAFRKLAKQHKFHIPSSPRSQLRNAIGAVFRSWYGPSAVAYRKIEGIPNDLGTAVNVQKMVFGNMDSASGTGVAFSRNPNSGDREMYGDFLLEAQGEDVVAGTHNTQPLFNMTSTGFAHIYQDIERISRDLERQLSDMVDIEFTVESGKLYMLQARVAKRNPQAAVKVATALLDEGVIDSATAQERISTAHEKWQNVETPATASKPKKKPDATGLGASPGIVRGKLAFNAEDAVDRSAKGENIILCRYLTEPSDVEGMAASVGILTQTGGLVSHAAVVARGWGKPCVVGASTISVSGYDVVIGSKTLNSNDEVIIDGSTGEVFIVG